MTSVLQRYTRFLSSKLRMLFWKSKLLINCCLFLETNVVLQKLGLEKYLSIYLLNNSTHYSYSNCLNKTFSPGGSSRCRYRQRVHIYSPKLGDGTSGCRLSHYVEIPLPPRRVILLPALEKTATYSHVPVHKGIIILVAPLMGKS